jgi:hypothetical protein
MKTLRTTSESPDFQKLVKQLDAYLAIMDGDERFLSSIQQNRFAETLHRDL